MERARLRKHPSEQLFGFQVATKTIDDGVAASKLAQEVRRVYRPVQGSKARCRVIGLIQAACGVVRCAVCGREPFRRLADGGLDLTGPGSRSCRTGWSTVHGHQLRLSNLR